MSEQRSREPERRRAIPFQIALALATVGLLAPFGWLARWFPAEPAVAPDFLPADKVVHLLLFAALFTVGASALVISHQRVVRSSMVLLVSLVLYGGLIEVIQGLLPWRGAEWADLGADAVGCILAAACVLLRRRW